MSVEFGSWHTRLLIPKVNLNHVLPFTGDPTDGRLNCVHVADVEAERRPASNGTVQRQRMVRLLRPDGDKDMRRVVRSHVCFHYATRCFTMNSCLLESLV